MRTTQTVVFMAFWSLLVACGGDDTASTAGNATNGGGSGSGGTSGTAGGTAGNVGSGGSSAGSDGSGGSSSAGSAGANAAGHAGTSGGGGSTVTKLEPAAQREQFATQQPTRRTPRSVPAQEKCAAIFATAVRRRHPFAPVRSLIATSKGPAKSVSASLATELHRSTTRSLQITLRLQSKEVRVATFLLEQRGVGAFFDHLASSRSPECGRPSEPSESGAR